MCVVFFVFYFFVLYFSCFIRIISLSETASSAVCLKDFWSGYKEDNFSLILENSTDSLPCDFFVFVSKLS